MLVSRRPMQWTMGCSICSCVILVTGSSGCNCRDGSSFASLERLMPDLLLPRPEHGVAVGQEGSGPASSMRSVCQQQCTSAEVALRLQANIQATNTTFQNFLHIVHKRVCLVCLAACSREVHMHAFRCKPASAWSAST